MSDKEKIGWTDDDVANAKLNRLALKEFHKTWFSDLKRDEKGVVSTEPKKNKKASTKKK